MTHATAVPTECQAAVGEAAPRPLTIARINAVPTPRSRTTPVNAASPNALDGLGLETSERPPALAWDPAGGGAVMTEPESC